MIITIISAILILLGVVFFFGAALGIVIFPDFFSRTHAAGKRRHLVELPRHSRVRSIPAEGFSQLLSRLADSAGDLEAARGFALYFHDQPGQHSCPDGRGMGGQGETGNRRGEAESPQR